MQAEGSNDGDVASTLSIKVQKTDASQMRPFTLCPISENGKVAF